MPKAQQCRLVLPDLHIPFEDRFACRKWLEHAKSLKPDAIDIIGDLIDAYPLSRFDKNPERRGSLQDELDKAATFLSEMRSVVGKSCEIRYSEGNHEQRLRRLLWGKCSEFAGLRNLAIPDLLDLPSRDIQWHPIGSPYQAGPLWFLHGDIIRKHSGATARAIADRVDGSVVCGHSHRMGFVPTTSWCGLREAVEVGHLTDFRKLEYVTGTPQWQQGWAVVYVGNGWADVSFCRVVRRPGRHGVVFVFQGKEL